MKEVFTDTDNFGVSFPLDLDVKLKAVLLGACFLIVSTCEENKHQSRCMYLHVSLRHFSDG